jgi:hypothetical protein
MKYCPFLQSVVLLLCLYSALLCKAGQTATAQEVTYMNVAGCLFLVFADTHHHSLTVWAVLGVVLSSSFCIRLLLHAVALLVRALDTRCSATCCTFRHRQQGVGLSYSKFGCIAAGCVGCLHCYGLAASPIQ